MISTTGLLATYASVWPEEVSVVDRFIRLLSHPDAYTRTHLPGHITGSSFIVNPERTQTVLLFHGKLKRWLQPGGHADGDTNVARVALREAEEETGLQNLRLVSPAIFDVDIHRIPARTDFQEHDHYDIRFLFEAPAGATLTVSDESDDVRWISLDELEQYTQEEAVCRLRTKLKKSTW